MSGTEWITPRPFIWLARQVLGDIDLDPASSIAAQRNVEAATYYTPDDNGLSRPWFGRVWLSPPNGRKGMPDFTGKLLDEFCSSRVTEAIALVPNCTDTEWFHRLAGMHMPMCVKRGRIRFESVERKSSTPANGQTFFYFGNNSGRFKSVFGPIGTVSRVIADCVSMADTCAAYREEAAKNRNHIAEAA